MRLISQVLITNDIEGTISALESAATTERIVKILEGEKAFSVDDARLAIEKAYMASEETTVIILAAKIFTTIVQNKLLKVIEEPPTKKEFILITPSKATILSTIRSRLPIVILNEEKIETDLGLDLPQLSLATAYEFIQSHKRTDAKAMKLLIENISKEAIRSQQYDLDEKTLALFSNAFVALDVGSPPQFVLTTLLLKLLARKKR
ncbi:DNA polymerase III subunit delta' [Sulfurovum sp. NBC37-1]|uniref:DNA polymerase III subunit delta' n=1 Tax=Sulfurovum sp. (strain NBC37-1) TaxID=387093 RepID=UPI00015878F3|nr:DNA polymerase III subunit delta' [Sulfurovum sp. NBC37-1]BAF71418.1 DNA polymerase III, delta' subunit [Sulfurovum sp. NBC37-1]